MNVHRESRLRGRLCRENERGFVLVCVLWVLAILTVIVIGFSRRSMLDRQAATYAFDHMKATYMARGAVVRGIVELRNKAIMDAASKEQGYTSYSQSWARPMDLLKDPQYFGAEGEDTYENDECTYRVRDEEGLISLNTAQEVLLDELDGLNRTAVRKIVLRRTGDPSQNEPAQAFQTVEEIKNIEGVSEKDWFGTEDKAGLRDLLTVCWGDGRININTAPEEVLESIPGLHKGLVNSIVSYRNGADGVLGTEDDRGFKSLEDVGLEMGMSEESLEPLGQYCKVDSQFFTITGVATLRQGHVRSICVATIRIEGGNAQTVKWREELLES